MTPKQKAHNLITRFANILLMKSVSEQEKEYAKELSLSEFSQMLGDKTSALNESAKQCALFHVNEILQFGALTMSYSSDSAPGNEYVYYSEVKKELENL